MEKQLQVLLRVENKHATDDLDFKTWGLTGQHNKGVRMKPKKQTIQAMVAPGKSVNDVLVFDLPDSEIEHLLLVLPGAFKIRKDEVVYR